ncbi:DM13 domain [Trinorchestia longiramus]|nr:DM13 domain [Trinorchestia longiramus]
MACKWEQQPLPHHPTTHHRPTTTTTSTSSPSSPPPPPAIQHGIAERQPASSCCITAEAGNSPTTTSSVSCGATQAQHEQRRTCRLQQHEDDVQQHKQPQPDHRPPRPDHQAGHVAAPAHPLDFLLGELRTFTSSTSSGKLKKSGAAAAGVAGEITCTDKKTTPRTTLPQDNAYSLSEKTTVFVDTAKTSSVAVENANKMTAAGISLSNKARITAIEPVNKLAPTPYYRAHKKLQSDNLSLDNRSTILSNDEELSYMKSQIETILNRNLDRRCDTRNIQESLSPSGLELGASAATMAASIASGGLNIDSTVSGTNSLERKPFRKPELSSMLLPADVHVSKFSSENSSTVASMVAKSTEERLFKPLSVEKLLGYQMPPSITDHILNLPKPQSATDFSRRQAFDFDSSITSKEEAGRRLSLTDVLGRNNRPGSTAMLESTRNLSEQISKSKGQSVHLPITPLSSRTSRGTHTLPKVLPSHQSSSEGPSQRGSKPIPPPLCTQQQSPLLSVQPLLTAIPPTPTTTANSPTAILQSDPSLAGIDSLRVGDLPGNLSATGFLGSGVIIRDGIIVRRLPSFPSSDSQASTSPVKGPSPPTSPPRMPSPPQTPRRTQRFALPASFSTSSEGRDSPVLPPKHDPRRLPPPPPPRSSKSPFASPKQTRSPSYRKTHSPTRTVFQYPSPKNMSPTRSVIFKSAEEIPRPGSAHGYLSTANFSQAFPSHRSSAPGGGVASFVDGVPRNAEGRLLYGPVLKQRPPLPRSSFSFNEDSTASTISSTSTKSTRSTPDTSLSGEVHHNRGIDSRAGYQKTTSVVKNFPSSRSEKISSTSSSNNSINSQEALSSKHSADTHSVSESHSLSEHRSTASVGRTYSSGSSKREGSKSVRDYTEVLNQLSSNYKAQEGKSGSRPSSATPSLKPEVRKNQEALEQRHLDLLRRQKQLQEQYLRLQTMQKSGVRLSAPNMDQFLEELNRRTPAKYPATAKEKRELLKKTSSEDSLLNRSHGMSIGASDAGGSMTNLLSNKSPETLPRKSKMLDSGVMAYSTGTISVIKSTNVDKSATSPIHMSTLNWPMPSSSEVQSSKPSGSRSSISSSSQNNPFRPTPARTTTVTTKILGSNLSSGRKVYSSRASPVQNSSLVLTSKKSSFTATPATSRRGPKHDNTCYSTAPATVQHLLQYSTTQYSTTQYSTTQYSTTQHSTVTWKLCNSRPIPPENAYIRQRATVTCQSQLNNHEWCVSVGAAADRKEVLGPYRKKDLVLRFPITKKGQRGFFDIKWISVWCERFAIDFGHVVLPEGLEVPHPSVGAGFLESDSPLLSSASVVHTDRNTITLNHLTYDGSVHDAIFVIGSGDKQTAGIQLPDEKGQKTPLSKYKRKTLKLKLPKEARGKSVQYVGVWSPTQGMISSVTFPQNKRLPPSVDTLA